MALRLSMWDNALSHVQSIHERLWGAAARQCERSGKARSWTTCKIKAAQHGNETSCGNHACCPSHQHAPRGLAISCLY
jgi:hypothetical protein